MSIDVWLEPRPIGLPLDNQVVGVVSESIERTLREDIVVEEGEPVGGVAIARDDGRGFSGALDEQLVHVATFLSGHWFEDEVVKDEQRQYLAAILASPGAAGIPKLVYLHHHPFERGFGLELIDSVKFLDCIANRVDVLCFGHRHEQRILGALHGVPHVVAADALKNGGLTRYIRITVDQGQVAVSESPIL
jgi:hypothetical protein